MMKRSIVTTEVAVCFTTLGVLVGSSFIRAFEASSRKIAGVGFEPVGVIPPPQALPNVMKGKTFALGKLLNVTILVQKQFRIEPRFGSEINRPAKRYRRNRPLTKQKSTNSEGQAPNPVSELSQFGPFADESRWKCDATTHQLLLHLRE